MKDYIEYLQKVLGVQGVMLPQAEGELGAKLSQKLASFYTVQGEFSPSEKQHVEVVFLNILGRPQDSLFNPAVYDLFEKMRGAMKIENLQVLELDCTVDDRAQLPSLLAEVCEARYIIVFSAFPKDIGTLVLKGAGRWIETHSPAYLMEDPSAKKVVWNDLKKIMRELGVL